MEHLDEKTIELYILEADPVKDARREIGRHLGECAGCAALHREMSEYYEEVSKIREDRSRTGMQALTLGGMLVRTPPYEGLPDPARIPATLPARIVLFVIRHYAVSAVSLAAALVAAFLVLSPRTPTKDLNPDYARPKDEFLVAYNRSGEELWRKHVATGFDLYVAKWPLNRRAIFTADADRDGKNEVYCIYGDIPDLPFRSAIVSYDWDGVERWRYWYHREIRNDSESFSDGYECNSMIVGDFARNGTVEIIAEFEHHERYPNVVVKLDALTGSLKGEYWHAGNIEYMAQKDFDGDGVDEIYMTNTSMFDGAAPLIVLDPRSINGRAPMPDGLEPLGVPSGTEKYYLLLPRSGLQSRGNFLSTAGEAMYFRTDSLLEVIVYDRFADGTSFALNFYFDREMRCRRVYASEPNLAYYRRLQQEELTKARIDHDFLEEMRSAILYWDGDKFVDRPAMNRHYLDAVRPPS